MGDAAELEALEPVAPNLGFQITRFKTTRFRFHPRGGDRNYGHRRNGAHYEEQHVPEHVRLLKMAETRRVHSLESSSSWTEGIRGAGIWLRFFPSGVGAAAARFLSTP
jgi:hypothetical protein